MNSASTPILFIIFNRPEPTKQVFVAIRKQQPKYLYVAADGPRADRYSDNEKCILARKIVTEGIDWDCEVKLLFRDNNLGCGAGPADAISWFFDQVEEGIVLEDDCLPNKSFFEFCTIMLERYRHCNEVMMISGTSYQPQPLDSYTYYFSKYVHVWGWATWRRAWKSYSYNLSHFDDKQDLEIVRRTFGTVREQHTWLRSFNMIRNGLDAWDYQWMHCIWRNHGLTIIPWKNMVANIGFGSDATHTLDTNSAQSQMRQFEFEQIIDPPSIVVHKKANKIERDKIVVSPLFRHIYIKVSGKVRRLQEILFSRNNR